MATTDIYHVVGSLAPARKAARFLGGDVDDYIQVNALAAARTAANDTSGSITAWINVPDITGTYTIMGFGDNDVVEFIDFQVVAGKLGCSCTDGTVAQFVSATDSVVLTPHQWYHVAVVQAADGLGPKFYVNGVKVASTNSVTTDVNEWFNNCDGIDTGRIGASNKAGDASVTNEFKGAISDIKYFSTALTAAKVLQDYESPETLYAVTAARTWLDMDDDYVDRGASALNGTVVGGIILCNNYSEFSSRLGFMTGTPVVADVVALSVNDRQGHAVVIKAA